MTNTEAILARSSELLSRVRKQIEDSPSFIYELMHPQRTPVAVPFAPTAISLDETGHSIQSAGEPPNAVPDSPGRSQTNDDETQRRLREFFASRMSALNSRVDVSRTSLTSLPSIPAAEIPHDEIAEPEPPEEQEEEVLIEQKPILDEPFVIVDPRTSLTEIQIPLLSPANVPYPIQQDDVPLVSELDIAEDGLWVPDLPLCKPENVRRLEYRLLWQDPNREKFFGADYALKIDSPPLSQIPPPFPIEPYDHYGRGMISYAAASVWGVEDIDIRREFHIEVRNINFLVHPLSCMEDILVVKIRQLYDAYIKDQDFSRVNYYNTKIKALRKAWKATKGTEEEKEIEIKLLTEIKDCREMREVEEHNSRMIREHLQQANNELKTLRSTSVTVSPMMLRWRRRNYSKEEKKAEQAVFDKEINRRVQEEMRLGLLQGEELDGNQIKQRILEQIDELGLRKPGEPLWRPVIENSAEVTPLEQCPPAEQQRREQIASAQIFLKYFINRQEQYKTHTVPIDQSFVASIEEGTNFISNVIPHKVSIEIWEAGYMKGSRFIASVTLPIIVGTSPDYGAYEFSADFTNADKQIIMGTLSARCYIAPEEKGQLFLRCPDVQSQKTKKRLAQDPSSFMSVARLLEWAENHDPNDPYTAAILSQVIAQRTTERVIGKFKLDTALESSMFSSLVPTSIGMQLQQHMERLKQQDEEQRRRSKKKESATDFVSKLKQTELVQKAQVTNAVLLTDVVREAPIPTVPTFFGWFREIMSMYRPLKPIRTPRIVSKSIESYSKVVIRIIRALNVPERTGLGTGPGTTSTLIYASTQSQGTKIFCRVMFNDEVKITRTVIGGSAEWNQSFDFQLSKNTDVVSSMNEIAKKNVRIDIFDEVTFSIVNDDRETQTTHEQTEKRILGTIEIPVSSLWATGKVDGTYPMITPPFQLAYTKPKDPLCLAVYATLDPPIVLPETNDELISGESEEVILRAQAWLKKITEMVTSQRRIKLMASPTGGKPIVACRMVRKQAPPPALDDPQQILRFVSMIPNVSDAAVFETLADMWCTSQEFLDLNAGDEEEHALLLCNFFKFKGMDAYVVLGYDYINGTTAFVATKEANRVTLWDPLTGSVWSSKDRFCTLYSVGVIFNDDNVWANIQNDTEPYRIDWNMHDPKKWYPFFSAEFAKPQFESPQEEVLNFKAIDDGRARQKERELDNSIKSAVEQWREHQRTSWNPQCSEKIRVALENCERAAIVDPKTNFQQLVDDFQRDFRNYRMTGCPFCLPFTTVDDIIKEVKIRETWKTESPNADFALGVLVVPYPNALLVVWVMVVALEYIQEARPPL